MKSYLAIAFVLSLVVLQVTSQGTGPVALPKQAHFPPASARNAFAPRLAAKNPQAGTNGQSNNLLGNLIPLLGLGNDKLAGLMLLSMLTQQQQSQEQGPSKKAQNPTGDLYGNLAPLLALNGNDQMASYMLMKYLMPPQTGTKPNSYNDLVSSLMYGQMLGLDYGA